MTQSERLLRAYNNIQTLRRGLQLIENRLPDMRQAQRYLGLDIAELDATQQTSPDKQPVPIEMRLRDTGGSTWTWECRVNGLWWTLSCPGAGHEYSSRYWATINAEQWLGGTGLRYGVNLVAEWDEKSRYTKAEADERFVKLNATVKQKTPVQLDFSDALKALRQGKRVRQMWWMDCWLGKCWLRLYREHDDVIYLCSSQGIIEMWKPKQPDLLATDWVVVEDVDGLYKPGV